ncbi:MAG: GNAT family N-acetyltransferase, partial [Thermovirgaceae bacterium]
MDEKHQFDHKLHLRQLRLDDFDDVRKIMDYIYPTMGGAWTREQFEAMLSRFPEGQLCIEDKGTVIAVALSLIIDASVYGEQHTYDRIVGDGTLKNHDPDGDYLYGIDVFVHPDYRQMRLGRRLYDARKELCETLNLKGIIIGGRIPGYTKYAEKMKPGRYVQMV